MYETIAGKLTLKSVKFLVIVFGCAIRVTSTEDTRTTVGNGRRGGAKTAEVARAKAVNSRSVVARRSRSEECLNFSPDTCDAYFVFRERHSIFKL